ncbi:MAG: polysaccharide biosynthesis tyrosine autokinase [Candidatus Omnitrophica bacterium]|nr:polysaccharide biosynthesis tyrosine autokinase [Candidatus Omnitrophota bacterium]
MLPNPEIREVTIHDYLRIIQKRIAIILSFFVIIPTAATIFVFTTKPVYRSTASVLIEKAAPKVTKFEEVYQPGMIETQQYYQTQYKILASRVLVERVFEDLRLAKDLDFREIKDPIQKLQKQIKIEPVRNSQIVLVNVEDVDALRASSIANALTKAYIQQNIEMRNLATKEAVGFLESQLTDLKKKMEDSEKALNKYIQQNKIVTASDIEQKTQGLLENLKQEKSKSETDLAENLKRYKQKHPKIIALNAQLAEINRKLEQETRNLLDLNQRMVQYNILKREQDSNQQLYTSMLTRAKETGVSEKLETSNVRVIDSAKPPDEPFKPKKARDIGISVLLALFCGISFVFFLEYLDASIRTAEDVSLYLSLPFLGYIPSITREAKTDAERALICYQKPTSTITESYRAVRTSILFTTPEDKPLKAILTTSSVPQEGKSFFSSNLASVFAQMNEKVVLIDVDMRRPKINKNFNIEQRNGLSNYLTSNIPLEQIIKPVYVRNLSIITSGTLPPNPSELLSSGKIRLLLEELKSKFDRIILDSPPILSVADTSLLANLVDGVVLVVKGGSTRVEAVTKAKQKILESKGKIIGVVINNIAPEKEDRYYYYHYYYSEEGKKQGKA